MNIYINNSNDTFISDAIFEKYLKNIVVSYFEIF